MAVSELLSIGQDVVRIASSIGVEAEAFVTSGRSTSFFIEKNQISDIISNYDFGIGIRILKNGRTGFAFCTEESKIKEAVAEAISVSRHTRKSKFSFPESYKPPHVSKTYDKKIPQIEPEDGREMAEMIIDSALENHKRSTVSGSLNYGYGESAIVNSRGLEVAEKETHISSGASVKISNATGFEFSASRNLDIDLEKIGGDAASLAKRCLKQRKGRSGIKTVVFSPFSISQLLEFIIVPAVLGYKAMRGESPYSKKIGENVADENLTIIDDQLMPGGLNTSISDDEGAKSSMIKIIEKGILKKFLFDIRTASEFNEKTTASAIRDFNSPPAVSGRNILIGGACQKLDELVSEIKDGIFVYDVMGAHTANPATGDFSVVSSIVFEIEKGEISKPLKPVMLNGNLPALLRKISMGDDKRTVPGSLTPVSITTSSIALENVSVST